LNLFPFWESVFCLEETSWGIIHGLAWPKYYIRSPSNKVDGRKETGEAKVFYIIDN
jgi:hypothetical protein